MSSVFAAIKDQDRTIQQLDEILNHKKINHGYLFIGKKGVGKKMTALAFAKELLCQGDRDKERRFEVGTFGDFLPFYDRGERLKIESIRQLIEESNRTTYEGNYRVIFVENGERMTEESSNALLKTLEEPPPGTVFIMTVSQPEKILPTLLSRMEKYYFNSLSENTLEAIFKREGYDSIPFKGLGSVDEIKILLDSEDEAFLLFPDFLKLLEGKELPALFNYAESLAKKPYLKALLSYYEKEASKAFLKTVYSTQEAALYEVIILSIEEAIRKINGYINEKHALEYSFLKIIDRIEEVSAHG